MKKGRASFSEAILLSIVIPCYNAYGLMGKCLAFFEDNYRDDVEIIVVDDCSTDSSFANLQEYVASSKTNIRLFQNTTNLGPGLSRNRGIEEARGKYITFLDADDYFESNLYDVIIHEFEKDIDMLVCDYKTKSSNGNERKHSSFFSNQREGRVAPEDAIVFLRGTTCCKFYRLSIVKDTGIRFLSQKRCEDIPFTKCITAFCKNIIYSKQPLYCYVQIENSLMHQSELSDPENAKRGFAYIKEVIGGIFPLQVEALFAIECLLSTALTNIKKMKRKEWYDYVTRTECLYPAYRINPYVKKYDKLRRMVLLLIHFRCYNLLLVYLKVKAYIKG